MVVDVCRQCRAACFEGEHGHLTLTVCGACLGQWVQCDRCRTWRIVPDEHWPAVEADPRDVRAPPLLCSLLSSILLMGQLFSVLTSPLPGLRPCDDNQHAQCSLRWLTLRLQGHPWGAQHCPGLLLEYPCRDQAREAQVADACTAHGAAGLVLRVRHVGRGQAGAFHTLMRALMCLSLAAGAGVNDQAAPSVAVRVQM